MPGAACCAPWPLTENRITNVIKNRRLAPPGRGVFRLLALRMRSAAQVNVQATSTPDLDRRDPERSQELV